MWFLIWTVLIAASLAIPAWLSWRIFVEAKALVRSLGGVTRALGTAQSEAHGLYSRWLEVREGEDADYAAELAERARPALPTLTLPTYTDEGAVGAARGKSV